MYNTHYMYISYIYIIYVFDWIDFLRLRYNINIDAV